MHAEALCTPQQWFIATGTLLAGLGSVRLLIALAAAPGAVCMGTASLYRWTAVLYLGDGLPVLTASG